MATTLVSVEEYLRTSFPDQECEYVDGQLVAKQMPDLGHSSVQLRMGSYLLTRYGDLLWVGTEAHMRVTATRYRIPDVVAILGGRPKQRFITEPPFIVVEIISPDDRVDEMEERLRDYLVFGIPNIWVLNPRFRQAFVRTAGAAIEITDGFLRTQDPDLEIPLAEIFADLAD